MAAPDLIILHSLAALGEVGLTPYMQALGDRMLPLPTVVLNGPGNLPGCCRLECDAASQLHTLLSRSEPGRWAVVVGYLSSGAQAGRVFDVLHRFRPQLKNLFVDPVCGDHGRAYVKDEIIQVWPRLLEIADWAWPNVTEVELLAGGKGEEAVARWLARFPALRSVITGWPQGEEIETRLYGYYGCEARQSQRQVLGSFSGTGDRFAAAWLSRYWVKGDSPQDAMAIAAAEVGRVLSSEARFKLLAAT